MKVNLVRALAFSLASCSLLAPVRAQYPQHAPSVLTAHQYRPVYFQDDQLAPPPDLQQVPVPPPDAYDPVAPKGAPAPYQKDIPIGSYGTGIDCGIGCTPECCSPWFGYVGGLLMTRDDDDTVWFSYDSVDGSSRVLTSRDADDFWSGGFEARIGRYFNCDCNAVELVYWGLYPDVSEANAYGSDMTGVLNTIIRFEDLSYDPGTGPRSVDSMYFDAQRHRLRRSYEAHNIELNLLGNTCRAACDPGLHLSWLAGVRYLRFDDGFEYATDQADTEFNYDPMEMFYDVDVENHLIGFQIGGRADYQAFRRARMFAATSVGIYGNHINHRTELYGANPADGHAYVSTPGHPFENSQICVSSSKDDVAFIGELRAGLDYQLSPCWSATLGYRVVGISGVALSTEQIPVDYLSSIPSVERIDSNGNLILHGFFAGATYNW